MMSHALVVLGPVSLGILNSLTSAGIGAIISGFFVQRYWASRAGESSLIDGLRGEVDALQEKSVDYWTLDCRGDSKQNELERERARVLATKIKVDIRKLTASLREYSQRYCKEEDFTQLMAEVSDACTNGDFEGKRRGPDGGRYVVILNATNRVKSTLLKRRV
jgi:hypothetical protein